MKSRDRTESCAQPCCGAGRRLHLDSTPAAARSKHSRETEGAGRDLSPSRASDVIDKECWYAVVRLWPVSAVNRWAEQVRSAQVFQTSTCSAIARASSTSMPRYRTVLSILVCPSKS